MRKEIILALLILLSLFAVVISSASWDICVSDGCSFSNNAYSNSVCIEETLSQHLNGRTLLFSAILKSQLLIILLAIIFISFFVSQKYLFKAIQLNATKIYVKYRLFNSSHTKLFDYYFRLFQRAFYTLKFIF